ncbi:MAG: hypothetical protein ABL931_17220 [Usitatibacteraceae bacterium]
MMNNQSTLALNISRARLENFAFVGKLIGSGVFAVWSTAARLFGAGLSKVKARIESPDEPKKLPPVYF